MTVDHADTFHAIPWTVGKKLYTIFLPSFCTDTICSLHFEKLRGTWTALTDNLWTLVNGIVCVSNFLNNCPIQLNEEWAGGERIENEPTKHGQCDLHWNYCTQLVWVYNSYVYISADYNFGKSLAFYFLSIHPLYTVMRWGGLQKRNFFLLPF